MMIGETLGRRRESRMRNQHHLGSRLVFKDIVELHLLGRRRGGNRGRRIDFKPMARAAFPVNSFSTLSLLEGSQSDGISFGVQLHGKQRRRSRSIDLGQRSKNSF